MSRINILDSNIYNRISAGEVVERPASVVKELMENSLDAKATFITIEIAEGGTKLIKITDNGVGVEYEDLKKAFLPHATSKIANVDDLDSIATLGFRGEALASIAAVSKVEMYSKTSQSEVGGKIVVEGGAFSEVSEYGCANGTTVIVRDLFFNTPARLKFLKNNKQEENAITNIVNRLILANPDVSVKYIVDGKVVYNSVVEGLREKIYTVYGKEFVENMIEINVNRPDYKLKGFISKPTFCKSNKTYQTLIVNGRYVANSLVTVAVSNAYENFLMKGKFPVFVLSLDMNYEDIDVNVHPSKLEVKFKNSKEVFNVFYSAVLEGLNENNFPVEYHTPIFEDANAKSDFQSLQTKSKPLDIEDNVTSQENLGRISGGFSFGDFKSFSDKMSTINVSAPKYEGPGTISVLKSDEDFIANNKTSALFDKVDDSAMEENLFNDNSLILKNNQEKMLQDVSYKIVGTIFNTYIVIESDQAVYIFDQHAGHERVLFDKFMALFEAKKLINQPLLLPYVFTVNELEDGLFENNLDLLHNFGFEIENFGKLTYKISSIPALLDGIDLKEFVDDLLSNTYKISSTNEQIKNRFASAACKAAIKGGQALSDDEIKVLLNKVLSNNTTLLCPHGRPVCVKVTKYEVEKMFKRIV